MRIGDANCRSTGNWHLRRLTKGAVKQTPPLDSAHALPYLLPSKYEVGSRPVAIFGPELTRALSKSPSPAGDYTNGTGHRPHKQEVHQREETEKRRLKIE